MRVATGIRLSRAFMGLFLALVLVPATVAARPDMGLPDFTALVQANSPGVVNIGTTRKVSVRQGLPPGLDMPENELFEEFLKRFFGGEGQGPLEEHDTTSLGSGGAGSASSSFSSSPVWASGSRSP